MVDFQAVLASNSSNAVALFGRGYAKRSVRDTTGGEADMNAARSMAPLVTADYWDTKLIPDP